MITHDERLALLPGVGRPLLKVHTLPCQPTKALLLTGQLKEGTSSILELWTKRKY